MEKHAPRIIACRCAWAIGKHFIHSARLSTQERQRKQGSAPLRDERAEGNAFYPHAKGEDEEHGGEDVDHVLEYGDKHRHARVLHANVPAVEAV